jgi:peptidoglycan/LPS O-acetylase OafA/YrhL
MKTAVLPGIEQVSAVPDLAKARIEGFDLLRGLCAIGVACYHILGWRDGLHLYSFGRYGVHIFFVLSGASMYIAYSRKFAQGYDPAKFILLRFMRLAPLFALVLALTSAKAWVDGKSWLAVLGAALLNLSFAFGLGDPVNISAVTGGWSLGIEFVFYFAFPLMLAVTRSRAWLVVLSLAFVLQHIWVARTLDGRSFSDAWNDYSHPLSFIFYFVAGCCIGRLVEAGLVRPSPHWLAGFVIAAAPLLTLHDDDNLVGATGVGLSLCAVGIALFAAGLPISRGVSLVSAALGSMSYGLYLIHSLVFGVANRLLPSWPTVVVLLLTLAVSAAVALALERYYEKPVQERVRRLFRI